MSTLRTCIIAGYAFAAVMAVGAMSADAQPLRPTQAAEAANGLPQARCSRPLDQEAERIGRLAEFAQKSRAMAQQNPLLLADVGYYDAELADSRRCVQSAAVR